MVRIKQDYWKKTLFPVSTNEISTFLFNLSTIALPAIALTSLWYKRNLSTVIDFVQSAGFGQLAQDYSSTLWQYWSNVTHLGISSYYTLLLIVLFVICIIFARKKLPFSKLKSVEFWIILAWFLVPFVILSTGVNKDVRFLSPAVPVLGLAASWLFFKTFNFSKSYLLVPLLMIMPVTFLIYTSLPLGNKTITYKNFIFLAPNMHLVQRPVQEEWPLVDILDVIDADDAVDPIRLSMAIDHPNLNISNLLYYNRLYFNNYSMATTAYLPKDMENAEIVEKLNDAEYLLLKTGPQGPDFTNYRNEDLKQAIETGDLKFALLRQLSLPDDSHALIYQRVIDGIADDTLSTSALD